MSIYQLLPELPLFPPADEAEADGLLAVGGDLSQERLLEAYRQGIFPWYEKGQPILWWSPDPRLVLFPEDLKISRSLRKVLRKGNFEIRFDSAFSEVIKACADVRTARGEGTWITTEMQEAYVSLHRGGFAHSAESWMNGELVGGLYGISLGQCFFGESMFSLRSDASKVALTALVSFAKKTGLRMIDCQITNPHLARFGAREIPRKAFLIHLKQYLVHPTFRGQWTDFPVTGIIFGQN